MNKTIRLAAVAATLLLAAGCSDNNDSSSGSADKPATPKASPSTASEPTGPPSSASLPDPPLYDPSTDAQWRIVTNSGCDIRLQKVKTSSNPDLEKYVKTVSKWIDHDTYTFFKIDIDNTQGSEECSVGNVTLIGKDQDEHEADGLSFWLDEGDPEEIPADPAYPEFSDLTDKLESESERKPGTKGRTWTLFTGEVDPFIAVYINDGTPMANVS